MANIEQKTPEVSKDYAGNCTAVFERRNLSHQNPQISTSKTNESVSKGFRGNSVGKRTAVATIVARHGRRKDDQSRNKVKRICLWNSLVKHGEKKKLLVT